MSKSSSHSEGSPTTLESLRFLAVDDVRRMREQCGTPVFVYDEASLERQARAMLAFPNRFGITVYYSLKGNANGAIIRIFDRVGLCFDASSIWEALRALSVGVDPSKILLTAQEVPEQLGEYVQRGLQFNACSLRQLDLYGAQFPGAEVSVRLNPGVGTGFINRLTSGGPRSSFGIWHEQLDQVALLIEKHRLRLKRIHHHVGSGHDPEEWLRIAFLTLDLAKRLGPVPIVNLGGGYRVKALQSEHEVDYKEIGERLGEAFEAYASETGVQPHLEIEPGTFLVANCGSLVTSITDVVSTGEGGYEIIKIDAGLTEVIRPGFYGSLHPLVTVPSRGPARQETKRYLVHGHTCIAGDNLTVAFRDPESIESQLLAEAAAGDLLVVERAGGYCASMSMKNFNSFPECPEVLKRKDGTFELIRNRQTLEQMIQNEMLPKDMILTASA